MLARVSKWYRHMLDLVWLWDLKMLHNSFNKHELWECINPIIGTYVICQVSLIINSKTCFLHQSYHVYHLLIWLLQKVAIININNDHNILLVKNTVINQRFVKSFIYKLVHQVLIQYFASCFSHRLSTYLALLSPLDLIPSVMFGCWQWQCQLGMCTTQNQCEDNDESIADYVIPLWRLKWSCT